MSLFFPLLVLKKGSPEDPTVRKLDHFIRRMTMKNEQFCVYQNGSTEMEIWFTGFLSDMPFVSTE